LGVADHLNLEAAIELIKDSQMSQKNLFSKKSSGEFVKNLEL
jgi:hypothetical protein